MAGKHVQRATPEELPGHTLRETYTVDQLSLLDYLEQLLTQQRLTNLYLSKLVGEVLETDDLEEQD